MDLNIALTIGKYTLLVGLYAFVLVVFRGIIGQLLAESRRERSDASAAGRRRVSAQSRLSRAGPPPTRPPAPEQAPAATMRSEAPGAPAPVLRPPESAPAPPSQASAVSEPTVAPSPEPEPAEDAERARETPHLHVIESDDDELDSGDRVPLSAAVTIGRSEENSLRLSDRFVSSRHALICLRDGRRLLLDRGSTNGTFVNGERVDEEAELQDGDRVAMGNTVFEYRTG